MGKTVILEEIAIDVPQAICKLSDDEGPDNDADMDRFSIIYSAANGLPNGSTMPIASNQDIYRWSTSGEVGVQVGDVWKIDKQANVLFMDGSGFDFDNATLSIYVETREYDSAGGDEYGHGHLELKGRKIYGKHKVYVGSSDAGFDVEINITEAP